MRLTVVGSLIVGFALAGTLGYRYARVSLPAGGPSDGDRPELRDLIRGVGSYRPLEPRLTGGFAYGAIPAAVGSSPNGRQLEPDARIAIARIEKNAAISAADSDWAAMGSAYLVAGDLDKGLRLLEAAVAAPIPSPLWLTDLSAAYLSVARLRNRPELLPKALAAAEKATRLNGRLREALFNRALALEAIRLTEQAAAAWTAYRVVDQDSAWSQEALAHLIRLDQEKNAALGRWDKVQSSLEVQDRPNVDSKALALVRHRLREWIESTLVPTWAERELEGRRASAEAQLDRARAAADLLVTSGGDAMARDGIQAIDRARSAPGRSAVPALARAHLAFRDAIRRVDAGDVVGADAACQTAAKGFSEGRSPYAHWAPMYRSVARYASRHFDDARAALTADPSGDVDARYRYLAGRRKWLLGLILANEGHLLPSLAEYRGAYDAFGAVGESEAEARVGALMAEVYSMLGAPADAWRYELAALDYTTRFALPPARQQLTFQLGSVLCLNDLPEAALHFQNAILSSSASESARPTGLVEGYFNRAQILHRLGDTAAARDDLARAKAQLMRIPDPSLRGREEIELLLAEALVLRASAPAEAIRSATRAIDFFSDSGGQSRMVELYLARGRAYLAARDPERAENDFAAAIGHFEHNRGRMPDRRFRASVFHDGWEAFAEMARVQVVARRNAAAGLDYAERGRARTLLEGAADTPTIEPLTTAAVQRRLPDRAAALFFMTLDDRLLIWTVTNARLSVVERPVGAAALRAKVDRLAWLLRQRSSDLVRVTTDLEGLFRELIEPVRSELSDVSTLAILPDGPLHGVPFSALIDPRTGRYLVQDFVVTLAPSLSTLVRRRHGSEPSSSGGLTALVVGNPARRRMAGEDALPPLPFSEDESQAVAATYPHALLLTRERATKRALLANLARFPVVHYGGHAVVNEQTPSLSRLLMATTDPGDDGTLFMSDLTHVRMDTVQLVVLAACSTASGAIANGEGVESVARPFLEAGAATVVATLWDVEDRNAAGLFQQFHRLVAQGKPPALALVLVQRGIIEDSAAGRSPARWAWAVSLGTLPSHHSLEDDAWRKGS